MIVLLNIQTFKSQNWTLTGNSGTNVSNNFLGTIDNNDLSIKTNNIERIKIGQGNIIFRTNKPSTDGIDILDESPNRNAGSDIVWIKSGQIQSNDIGLLTLATVNWEYPVFSARENGKVLPGIKWNNTGLLSCSDCSNYRLFVKDGIKTEKIKVDIAVQNGWADYVFEDDYNLIPLNTLEKFITKNKHLPEVPTTSEVLKNGIELKEMNILLLKKIEELTLYLIDLNRKLEKQDNEIKNLKKQL